MKKFMFRVVVLILSAALMTALPTLGTKPVLAATSISDITLSLGIGETHLTG